MRGQDMLTVKSSAVPATADQAAVPSRLRQQIETESQAREDQAAGQPQPSVARHKVFHRGNPTAPDNSLASRERKRPEELRSSGRLRSRLANKMRHPYQSNGHAAHPRCMDAPDNHDNLFAGIVLWHYLGNDTYSGLPRWSLSLLQKVYIKLAIVQFH